MVSELQKGRAEDTEKLDHIGRSVDELKAKFEALYSVRKQVLDLNGH